MSSRDDLIRWGLHLLETPLFSSGGADDSPNDSNSTRSCCCDDDEALAISLQQSLYYEDSSPQSPPPPQQQQQAPQPPQAPEIGDFFDRDPRKEEQDQDRGYSSREEDHPAGNEDDDELCEDCAAEEMSMGNHNSSSRSSGNFSYDHSYDHAYDQQQHGGQSSNENDEAIAVILSEELAQLDGSEVGRRLTHMESIPHIPKINGEIPSPDAASLDHQRLLERLQVYGLTEHKIPGDGNCQFRALSDQFYRTPDHHMFVRKEIIKQLKQDPAPYEGYVPMRFNDYLKKMAKNGEWGDHVTLQAAADVYGMKICLITSFRDTCIIDIVPKEPKSERVIFLSFWAEVHYNSVYPEGEVPVSYQVRKKRHWCSFFG